MYVGTRLVDKQRTPKKKTSSYVVYAPRRFNSRAFPVLQHRYIASYALLHCDGRQEGLKNCRCCHGFFICFVFTRTKNGGISTPTRPPVHIVNKYVMSSVVLACAKKTQVQKPASRKNRQRQHEASKKETSIDPCSTSIAHPPLHPRRDFIFFDRERDYASLACGKSHSKSSSTLRIKHQFGSPVQPRASNPKIDKKPREKLQKARGERYLF